MENWKIPANVEVDQATGRLTSVSVFYYTTPPDTKNAMVCASRKCTQFTFCKVKINSKCLRKIERMHQRLKVTKEMKCTTWKISS